MGVSWPAGEFSQGLNAFTARNQSFYFWRCSSLGGRVVLLCDVHFEVNWSHAASIWCVKSVIEQQVNALNSGIFGIDTANQQNMFLNQILGLTSHPGFLDTMDTSLSGLVSCVFSFALPSFSSSKKPICSGFDLCDPTPCTRSEGLVFFPAKPCCCPNGSKASLGHQSICGLNQLNHFDRLVILCIAALAVLFQPAASGSAPQMRPEKRFAWFDTRKSLQNKSSSIPYMEAYVRLEEGRFDLSPYF